MNAYYAYRQLLTARVHLPLLPVHVGKKLEADLKYVDGGLVYGAHHRSPCVHSVPHCPAQERVS